MEHFQYLRERLQLTRGFYEESSQGFENLTVKEAREVLKRTAERKFGTSDRDVKCPCCGFTDRTAFTQWTPAHGKVLLFHANQALKSSPKEWITTGEVAHWYAKYGRPATARNRAISLPYWGLLEPHPGNEFLARKHRLEYRHRITPRGQGFILGHFKIPEMIAMQHRGTKLVAETTEDMISLEEGMAKSDMREYREAVVEKLKKRPLWG